MTIRSFSQLMIRHSWIVIFVSFAIVLSLAYGTRHLTLNADSRAFFSADNPQLLELQAFEDTYTKDDYLMFVLAPADADVFTPRVLDAVHELTEASWHIPYSSRVSSVTNFLHLESVDDELTLFPLVRASGTLSAVDIERTRSFSLRSPQLSGRLLDKDGTVTAVVVGLPSRPGGDIQGTLRVAAEARKMAGDLEQRYPDIKVYVTGNVMFEAAFFDVPLADLATLGPLMCVLFLLIVGLGLRTLWGTVGTLLVIVMSGAAVVGAAGWSGAVLATSSLSVVLVIFTVSVAYCVHTISTKQLARQDGATRDQSIHATLSINLSPMAITAVTTAIGFSCLNFSDAPPFRSFGSMSAAGVVIAFVLSVTFLPAFLSVTPDRVRPGQARSRLIMEALAELLINHRSPILWGTGVLVAVSVVGIGLIRLDDNLARYFGERTSVRSHAAFVEEHHLIGLNYISYSFGSGAEGGITEPEYLSSLDRLAEWYRNQPGVSHVDSFSNVMKTLNQGMNGGDPEAFQVPRDPELAAQFLLLYELSLPQGFDLNNQVNIDRSSTRFTVSVNEGSSVELRQLAQRADAWMTENTPRLRAPPTGLPIAMAHLSDHNVRAMLLGNLVVLVGISAILILVFGSLKFGLISLVPNILPTFVAFGLWGHVVGEVGLAITVVMALTLGIVVDDTVHFLSKYIRARRRHRLHAPMACLFAFGTVGPALWITSLALLVGFGVLGLSSFKVNAHLGLLSAGTIAIALILDFVVLPPLLMRLDRRDAP